MCSVRDKMTRRICTSRHLVTPKVTYSGCYTLGMRFALPRDMTNTNTEKTFIALGLLRQSPGVYLAPACFTSCVRRAALAAATVGGWTERKIATPNGTAYLFIR